MSNSQGKKKKKYPQKVRNNQITYTADDVLQMMNDTSDLIAQENAMRLSAAGPSAGESGVLTDSVEFWKWMNRNYENSGHFSSAESMKRLVSDGTKGQKDWAKKIVQGKGYEWDWMSSQRKNIKNLFKTFDAGDIANRPGSDITVHDVVSGENIEQQLKAYTSKNTPHLKNTPKSMQVVTNAEKVQAVKDLGYEDVVSFGNNDSIQKARDGRIEEMASGKATPAYNARNISTAAAKAGILGFAIGTGIETIASYKKWKDGRISGFEYLKEIIKSGGNAGITATFSAGIMIPVTIAVTTAGASSLITIPVSFVVSSAVDKVVAPAFARGDYIKILREATYYKDLVDYCCSMTISMEKASEQYGCFVQSVKVELREFYEMRGQVLSDEAIDDFDYLASQPKGKIEMTIAGMMSLINNTDDMLEEIENQPFYQRMIKTVLGKNKATKEEIRKNYEKLTVYISEAIAAVYERQNIDERVTQMFGKQILDLCSDNIMIAQRINHIMDTVSSHHKSELLRSEIISDIYHDKNPFVAICEIVSQLDYRLVSDKREMRLLRVIMCDKGILSSKPITQPEFIDAIYNIPDNDIGVVYACLISVRKNKYAKLALSIIEKKYFVADESPISLEQIKESTEPKYAINEFCYNQLFDELIQYWNEDKIEYYAFDEISNESKELNDEGCNDELKEAEALFYDGKLIEALSIFETAAISGFPRAYYYLALYYENGYGHLIPNEEKAREYLEKGMEEGDQLCAYKAGEYKFSGLDDEIQKWKDGHINTLKRLADMNDPAAMNEYGLHTIISHKEDVDLILKGVKWFQNAAKLGYWPGAFNYFQFTEDMRLSGADIPDYSGLFNSVEWYLPQTSLGRYYILVDKGDLKHYQLAVRHLKKSLWLLDRENIAAGYMAFLLNTGLIKDSIAEGIFTETEPAYYKAGLESDNPLGLYEIGYLYMVGLGETEKGKSPNKAYQYLKKSYELKKNQFSALLLGLLEFGEGKTEEDEKLAVKYLTESLEMGEDGGAEALSLCYEHGIGTKKNISKANELKERAKRFQMKPPSPIAVINAFMM